MTLKEEIAEIQDRFADATHDIGWTIAYRKERDKFTDQILSAVKKRLPEKHKGDFHMITPESGHNRAIEQIEGVLDE